jgi:hypothetical protein
MKTFLVLEGSDNETLTLTPIEKTDDYAYISVNIGEPEDEYAFALDVSDLDDLIEWANKQKELLKGKTPS